MGESSETNKLKPGDRRKENKPMRNCDLCGAHFSANANELSGGRLLCDKCKEEPRCDCGTPGPTWHGPRDGHRQFMCDRCWLQLPEHMKE